MGALVSRALRPIKSWNIENRAHREISKEKPKAAPKYRSNIEDLQRALQADPDLEEKLDKKDQGLDDRLKNVYVTAMGRPEDDISKDKRDKSKVLPQDRKLPEDYEYGFKEPERVPYGRTTLRYAMNFISAHQASPAEVTPTKIALEYKLKEEDVQIILKYFKTFEIYIPETKTSAATFAGPATFRKLRKESEKHLAEPSSTDSEDKKDVNIATGKTHAKI